MPDKRLDRLFQACHRDVERFLERRVPSPEIAADLMQEAFLRLARAEPATLVRDAKAYLFRTADNLVTDYYRAQARDPTVRADDAAMHLLPDPAPAPDAVAEAREELDVLRRAIDDLPPRGREVFVLHKFEGLGYAAIAERLGISKNTVVVHMVRSLAHCNKRLEAYRRQENMMDGGRE